MIVRLYKIICLRAFTVNVPVPSTLAAVIAQIAVPRARLTFGVCRFRTGVRG